MTRGRNYELRNSQKKTFKPEHDTPGEPWFDYILLPYGMFYTKTNIYLEAKKGDLMIFSDGVQVNIDSVTLIEGERVCDVLCRIRYGVQFKVALHRWQKYARMEGNGRDILSPDKCLMVVYAKEK